MKDKFGTQLVDMLDEVYKSVKFQRCLQKPGESVESVFTALRSLVKNCSHFSIEVGDRLVRNQFVVGLLDRQLNKTAYHGERKTSDTDS